MTTSTDTRATVVGVFDDREDARDAIEALKDTGFSSDSISVLSPDKQATQEIADDTGTHAGSGATTGAVAGGVLGGIGGWLIGIGALAIPGVGPFIAAGAFATALGGAAIGAGVGAIAGALVGMGVPEDQAKYYEGEAKAGKTLVTVRAGDRYDEAQRILRDQGAYHIQSRDRTSGASTLPLQSSAVRPSLAGEDRDTETVRLREEELVANKQTVETGQVRVGKEVVSEERTIDVPVTREEVYIERTPVDRHPSDRPMDDRGETISMPVREEQVEVEKRAVVYEEVDVGKREVQGTQQVSGTVRREEARIERQGDVSVAGSETDRPAAADPGYRYGYEMRDRPEYRGRTWSEVEPEAQRAWTQRYPNTPWNGVRESIREAWEQTRE
jgi:uncharacterized protein (TIGR02271 family)